MKIKTRFYAGNLVFQGPSGTYGVGQIRRRGRVPDGLPDRSSDAARNATQAGATFAGHEISNLIVSPARFSPVGPSGSICRRARRLVIEIRQIWGWVSWAANRDLYLLDRWLSLVYFSSVMASPHWTPTIGSRCKYDYAYPRGVLAF